MTNSADPDQLASSEANWSGSTLFAKKGYDVFSKRMVSILSYTSDTSLIILDKLDLTWLPIAYEMYNTDKKTWNTCIFNYLLVNKFYECINFICNDY